MTKGLLKRAVADRNEKNLQAVYLEIILSYVSPLKDKIKIKLERN